MTRRLTRRLLLSLLVLAGVLVACDGAEVAPSPTQVMLEIHSGDDVLLGALTHLRVSVALREGDGWRERRAVEVGLAELRWPVEIPVTPRSDADAGAQFEVVVQALADGRVLAETRAIAGFARNQHKTLKLQLFLCPGHDLSEGYTCAVASCLGEDCEVCAATGQCLPVTQIDPEDLPTTPVPVRDAGNGMDASDLPLDGGTDGEAEVSEPPPDADMDAEASTDGDASAPDGAMDASTPPDATLDAAQDGAADASDGSTSCQPNFKRCGAACIPVAQCCTNGDCASGTLCRQGMCKRWCEEQTFPVGVLASDYQCLDFEQGLPPTGVWARTIETTGTLALATDRASSQPSSVRMSTATLAWTATGSAQIKSLSFAAAFNPTQHPTVLPEPLHSPLVCFNIGDIANGSVLNPCIMYTYKGSVDGVDNYTGLYLETFVVGPPAIVFQQPLHESGAPGTPLTFNTNVWNQLSIQIGNGIQVRVNNKVANVTGGAGQDTQVRVSFGADWTANYDNVVVSVGR